jgi:hypothetical protein
MLSLQKIIIFCSIGLLLSINSMAQPKDPYKAQWKKIDSLVQKQQQTKTAIAEINKLYTLATKEKQQGQVIKALIYKISLQNTIEENAEQKGIAAIEVAIATSEQPVTAILQTALADKYYQYYQQHRYQLYDRTQTVHFKKEDMATWGMEDFHQKISELYWASLQPEKILQQTSLASYDPIIAKGNARYLRPSLYDLLAFKALAYFDNDEKELAQPAYAFEIKDPAYFAEAARFAQLKISTQDSASFNYKALLIYQRLLTFHLLDEKPDALIDANLHRIQFVKIKAVMDNKESLYTTALEAVEKKYNGLPTAAQATYLLAQWHALQASSHNEKMPLTNRIKDAYTKALLLCKKVLAQKEESEGKTNCYNLVKEIERKELALSTEKINVPHQPFRTLVSYKNISAIHLRLLPLSTIDEVKMNDYNSEENYWKTLVNKTPIRSWKQTLPTTTDHYQHHVEIKIDALPVGEYILLTSVDSNFSLSQNPLAAQAFYVSNISYLQNDNNYFVLHRETGDPLSKATVQIWNWHYDYNTRKYLKQKETAVTTNNNGYFQLPYNTNNDYNQGIQLEITYEKDRLFMHDNQYLPYRNQYPNPYNDKAQERVFFFTDRSIYRPGQIIYFKAIAINYNAQTKTSSVNANRPSTVTLMNANHEKVETLSLQTNEFGSYTGKFILPENILNGQFYLLDEQSHKQQYFSVEEYKRPQFYIAYEPIKGSYKVNDSLTIIGTAKAYAGSSMNDAKVSFAVQRRPRFIYDWCFGRWGIPPTNPMEIMHGTATTNADGQFTIRFKAIPDLSIDSALEPVFDYRVTANATDQNGETHTSETTVSVSYKALLIKLSSSTLPDASNKNVSEIVDRTNTAANQPIPINELKAIEVTTTNTNGQFEPTKVKLTIYKLQSPAQLLRNRFWQQPDQFILNKAEYHQAFPYDEYNNELDKNTWLRTTIVFTKEEDTKEGKPFQITNTPLAEGWYVIEATAKDKYGAAVKEIQYVQLYNPASKQMGMPQYLMVVKKNKPQQPGTKDTITLGSAANNLFIIQQINKPNSNQLAEKESNYNFIHLNNERKELVFPVSESDRGNFGVTHCFVKNNRLYETKDIVWVPFSNKNLNVSVETFRDKTLPGSEEKWKIKITGLKKDKVAAELLTSMYDASLDQFKPHDWAIPNIWQENYFNSYWNGSNNFTQVQSRKKYWEETLKHFNKTYDYFYFDESGSNYLSYAPMTKKGNYALSRQPMAVSGDLKEVVVTGIGHRGTDRAMAASPKTKMGSSDEEVNNKNEDLPNKPNANLNNNAVQIRKNFNETAFFFPNLQTDSVGSIAFAFTMPEALTQWKLQALAHTKDLAFGYALQNVVTQKPLMVQPNMPRFLRQGDKMELSAKISNLYHKELTGTVNLELVNATTGKAIDGWFKNMYPVQYFTAEAAKSTVVKFTIEVPYQYNDAVIARFVAKAVPANAAKDSKETMSDGEEKALPVINNSMLVTESIPLNMRGTGTKNFTFKKLLNSHVDTKNASATLQHHALTVEFTPNPAWYAVQALPYLMEYPYECAEQTFNRYYANAIATHIANKYPNIKSIFEKWATTDTAALLSNLQKNQELKAVLLTETPWVLDANNEAQQKKNIALLFNLVRMSNEMNSSFDKLKKLQSPNGGFTWFNGGPDDRNMTQYIITGLGHLKKLGVLSDQQQSNWNTVLQPAIAYLDARLQEDYNHLLKYKAKLTEPHLGYLQIQYGYLRSFFTNYPIPEASKKAVAYYNSQAQLYWAQQSKYMQAMIALSLHRGGDKQTPPQIIKSLQENAISHEEMGMYWKENTGGYYWHQAPVEIQSILIEAFAEITNNHQTVDALKTWLLKQKQTQNWKTTKATAEACYALLLQGDDWLAQTPSVEIKLADKLFVASNTSAEAGTGYLKKRIEGPVVNSNMGTIKVTVTNTNSATTNTPSTSWGAMYWQYFEQLDKITFAATPLSLNKKLFIEKNTDRGVVLQPINEDDKIKIGDKIKVRVELRVDRDMEYVHMKDMRASALEPLNVLSTYKWQGGLGYYESTKDASTHFFFNWLPKGTYVFEYPLFATHTGNFSNGITSIQCMYAPEFTAHSEGVRIQIE